MTEGDSSVPCQLIRPTSSSTLPEAPAGTRLYYMGIHDEYNERPETPTLSDQYVRPGKKQWLCSEAYSNLSRCLLP